ncbi:Uncharacterized protein MSYG_1859 [Malassezia sympodialis ATCC 42132]|uniref:Uncharacterized protein n=1 Tax=Malassezia sympodialis (strain ATCC 42132) TaxID=1230383 RepID=A0A1M8A544_MALS4|nr:Uncharacterized protein MSYG_1859 [Malassezia sympodialis ATCC 42132]
MAGPNMEVFRFGLYLLFPLGFMLYFGDPSFYEKHVLPLRDRFTPPETGFRQPRSLDDIRETLGTKKKIESVSADPQVQHRLKDWALSDKERLI